MKMNSEYGGEQREMYPTKIIMEDGYISPHAWTIDIGGDQNMAFQEVDNGTFCITTKKRVYTKFSQYYEPFKI